MCFRHTGSFEGSRFLQTEMNKEAARRGDTFFPTRNAYPPTSLTTEDERWKCRLRFHDLILLRVMLHSSFSSIYLFAPSVVRDLISAYGAEPAALTSAFTSTALPLLRC